MKPKNLIYRVTITENEKNLPGGVRKFNTKEHAEMFISMNVESLGGIEKEINDIFSRTVITKRGFKIVAEKIDKL